MLTIFRCCWNKVVSTKETSTISIITKGKNNLKTTEYGNSAAIVANFTMNYAHRYAYFTLYITANVGMHCH